MRIRSIKPEFWRSDDVSALAWEDRLLFIGLWSYVDDNGVGRDRLSSIVADLFADDLEKDAAATFARVSRGLQALSDGGQIARYTVDGKGYLYVVAWSKHQKVDRPNKPRYPLPPGVEPPIATPSRGPREAPSPGSEEQGNRGSVSPARARPLLDADGLTRIKQLTQGTDAHARKCAEFILAKAPAEVRNPTAYVVAAIADDPGAFRFKRGTPKPGEFCPAHTGEWADACRACAADRKAIA